MARFVAGGRFGSVGIPELLPAAGIKAPSPLPLPTRGCISQNRPEEPAEPG